MKKIVQILVLILVLFGIALFIYSRNNRPTYKGSADLPGLKDEVMVYFDDYGVPHIYGNNEEDAYVALGYLHAQDRLWQMELVRRIAAGRLAEIFGPELVKTDKFFKGLGIEHATAKTLKAIDSSSPAFRLSLAYLKGVNHYIENGKTPVEFSVLGIDKERYDLNDIYNVYGYMSFGFAQAHKTDPLLSHLRDKLGDDYISDLDIDIDPRTTLIKNARRKDSKLALRLSGEVDELLQPSPIPPFIGSNSWVIGPDKTKNKKVIFANDPHIGFAQPAVWYQAHVVTPDYEMYGFHLALSPFPLLGHNRDYAYGLTMLENDDIDFYYVSDTTALETRTERIKVKGEDDLEFGVRISDHGPIMNDLLEGMVQELPVAMDWVYTKLDNEMVQVAYGISHASGLSGFRQSASQIHAPGLNLMYGDAKGNIAWFGAARLYEKEEGVHTKFILDGNEDNDVKVNYLDFAQNPQAINPRWDYVYSANNQPEPVNGKLYPGYYLPEDRAKRIVEILEGKDDFVKSDVEDMIFNVESSQADQLIRVVIENMDKVNLSELEKEALQMLKQWDGAYKADQASPTIYFTFLYHLMENTFADEMGTEAFDRFIKTHLSKRQIGKQIRTRKSIWWDDINTKDVKENRDEIFTRSYHEAISRLEEKLGDDLDDWTWDKVASVTHRHTFDKSGLLKRFFNVGPFVTHGGNEVINNQLFQLNGDMEYNITAGPSTRRVIDFSDIENAVSIVPTGQSGNVFSRHYDDQAQKYLDGEFIKMMLNENEIKASKNKLVLTPQN